jgi:hypothetical protein
MPVVAAVKACLLDMVQDGLQVNGPTINDPITTTSPTMEV